MSESAGQGRSFRAVLICCGLVTAAGCAALLYGRAQPAYQVPYEQASATFAAWCDESGRASDIIGDRYLAMFGLRYSLTNAGISLLLGAISVAFLSIGLWLNRASDTSWLRTPKASWTFIVIGIGAVALLLAGVTDGLYTDLRRRMFPPCADSIGIPLVGLAMFGVVALPILTVAGWLVARGFGELPVSLFQWDATRPRRSWSVTLGFLSLMIGAVVTLAAGITLSDIISPAIVVIIYLLASARAALLAPGDQDRLHST